MGKAARNKGQRRRERIARKDLHFCIRCKSAIDWKPREPDSMKPVPNWCRKCKKRAIEKTPRPLVYNFDEFTWQRGIDYFEEVMLSLGEPIDF